MKYFGWLLETGSCVSYPVTWEDPDDRRGTKSDFDSIGDICFDFDSSFGSDLDGIEGYEEGDE